MKNVPVRGFSGPYFPVFSQNTGIYGPKKTPYLDTFHSVILIWTNELSLVIAIAASNAYLNPKKSAKTDMKSYGDKFSQHSLLYSLETAAIRSYLNIFFELNAKGKYLPSIRNWMRNVAHEHIPCFEE